jgi:hypothetical protein
MEIDPDGPARVYLKREVGGGVNYEEAYTVEFDPIGEVIQLEVDTVEILENGWVKLPQIRTDGTDEEGYYPPTSVIRIDGGERTE